MGVVNFYFPGGHIMVQSSLSVVGSWIVPPAGPLPLPPGAVAGCVASSQRSPSGRVVRFAFAARPAAAAFALGWSQRGVRASLTTAASRQFARGAWVVSLPAVGL